MNIEQFSQRDQAFLTALKYFNDRDFKGHQKKLADLGQISNGYLSEILGFKKICKPIKQESLAMACGYSHEKFIKIGEEILSLDNQDKANAIVEAAKSIKNPMFYKLQKMAEESFNKFQKDIEKINAQSIQAINTISDKNIVKDEFKKISTTPTDIEKHTLSKHQKLVPEFPHADLAYEINCNLLKLDKLNLDNKKDLIEINETIKTKIRLALEEVADESVSGDQ